MKDKSSWLSNFALFLTKHKNIHHLGFFIFLIQTACSWINCYVWLLFTQTSSFFIFCWRKGKKDEAIHFIIFHVLIPESHASELGFDAFKAYFTQPMNETRNLQTLIISNGTRRLFYSSFSSLECWYCCNRSSKDSFTRLSKRRTTLTKHDFTILPII